jgi:hypothetical protein
MFAEICEELLVEFINEIINYIIKEVVTVAIAVPAVVVAIVDVDVARVVDIVEIYRHVVRDSDCCGLLG